MLKIGDKVIYTNPNGVVIRRPYTVMGFCEEKGTIFEGRVYVDSDSPWYPIEANRLKLDNTHNGKEA